VRFLVDQGVSPIVAVRLREAGHDAVHVSERGLGTDSDASLLAVAESEARVLITRDLDFTTLATIGVGSRASIIQLRQRNHRPLFDAAFLVACLPGISDDLMRLAIVSISEAGIRVRRLPTR
jgi:predicted nuclease of predicted toxin-antitoxin system